MMKHEVRIYSDPVTMKDFEGSANVLKVHRSDDLTSYCRVRFLAGPQPRLCDRWVDNEQLKTAGIAVPTEG